MSEKKPNTNSANNPARRRLLGILSVGGGATLTIPTSWRKPAVDAALLPAHSRTTEVFDCNLVCTQSTFGINMSWNASIPVNMDLVVETPNGTVLDARPGPSLNLIGRCTRHQGPASTNTSGSESTENITEFVGQRGTFQVTLRNNSGSSVGTVNVGVFSECNPVTGSHGIQINDFPANTERNVGTVRINTDGSWTTNLSFSS